MHLPLSNREHTRSPKRSAGQIRKISAISPISVPIHQGREPPEHTATTAKLLAAENAFVCIRDFRVIRGFNRQHPAKVLPQAMH
jgi:hypothetical protein